ncbi:DNA primase [Spirochaeta africana]|uniref:DNA primase n=1 Tax=Spirochaeta africana (strain ATCC 700263 / DSM 8902 / Z-7692) TaxID=889378 RepID=H9UJ66_SPIAZ|nr:DNA primase [Spirochaeta africana]AFG37559.1 DNA primase, catalytic core [Spirochaeta africana DSM 8902]
MAIPQHVIEEVTRRLDIVELVSDYVQLSRKGNRFWGLSPFKTEKTPSFSVDPDKQLYYCFSTQQGGTAITFYMQMEGLAFPQAIERLAERVGVALEHKELTAAEKRRAALFELYDRVTNSFAHIFNNSDQAAVARRYMADRGFSAEVLQQFAIGFCPADPFWLYDFLQKKGYSPELLSHSGLFTRKNPRRALFAGRIMFAIRNETGRVVAFGGRSLQDDGPKYINSPETDLYSKSRILYGFWEARQSIRSRKNFIVVEGYMDLLAMHQGGYTHAIAPLGTAFTEDHARLLSRFAEEAVLAFDSDAAGYKAALRTAQLCEKNGLIAKALLLPEGADPADLLEKGGLHGLRNSVSSPVHVLEYLYAYISSHIDSGSVDRTYRIIRELAPYLSGIRSAVQREASFTFLGEKLGIDPQAIRSDVAGNAPNSASRKPAVPDRKVRQPGISPELFLGIAAVANPDTYPFIRRNVEIDALQDEQARELFIALEDSYRRGDAAAADIVERIEDDTLKQVVLQRLAGSEYTFADDTPIKEAVQRIRERNVRMRKNYLQQELQNIKGTDIESIDQQNEIMAEIIHLDTILRDVRESADEGNAK